MQNKRNPFGVMTVNNTLTSDVIERLRVWALESRGLNQPVLSYIKVVKNVHFGAKLLGFKLHPHH